jgi:hypothetical protein
VLFLALLGCDKMEKVSPIVADASNAGKTTARVEEGFILKFENLHPQIPFSTVQYNGNFLEFSDPIVFEKIKKDLSNKDQEVVGNWEKQFGGFQSLRAIFQQATNAQVEFQSQIQNLTLQDQQKFISKDGYLKVYADFVNKYKKAFIFYENPKCFLMNICDESIAGLVNQDGFVKIGKYLFQYTHDEVKVIEGDKEKMELLRQAKEDDRIQKIIVKKIERYVPNKVAKNGRSEENPYIVIRGNVNWVLNSQSTSTFRHFYQHYLQLTFNPIYYYPPVGSCGSSRYCDPELVGWSADTYYYARQTLEHIVLFWYSYTGQPLQTTATVTYTLLGGASSTTNIYQSEGVKVQTVIREILGSANGNSSQISSNTIIRAYTSQSPSNVFPTFTVYINL